MQELLRFYATDEPSWVEGQFAQFVAARLRGEEMYEPRLIVRSNRSEQFVRRQWRSLQNADSLYDCHSELLLRSVCRVIERTKERRIDGYTYAGSI